MTATARGVGLRVDWWVDERRDPVRSTKAAARFLSSAAATSSGRCTSPPRRTTAGRRGFPAASLVMRTTLATARATTSSSRWPETRALRSETVELRAAADRGGGDRQGAVETRHHARSRSLPYAYDSVLVPRRTAIAAVKLVTGAPLDSLRELQSAPHPRHHAARCRHVGAGACRSCHGVVAHDCAHAGLLRAAWKLVKVKKATTVAAMAKAMESTRRSYAGTTRSSRERRSLPERRSTCPRSSR